MNEQEKPELKWDDEDHDYDEYFDYEEYLDGPQNVLFCPGCFKQLNGEDEYNKHIKKCPMVMTTEHWLWWIGVIITITTILILLS